MISWILVFFALWTNHQIEVLTAVDCGKLECKNGASCYTNINTRFKECNCTPGFGGPTCGQSAVNGLEYSIALLTSIPVNQAEQYAVDAQTILDAQRQTSYSSLEQTIHSVNYIGANLTAKVGPSNNLTSLTTELTGMTSSVLTAVSTCVPNHVSGCSLDATRTKAIIEKTEENLANMIHLMLNTTDVENPLPINKDNISMTVFKANGGDLPFDYSTNYGALTLPYWETFQDKNKGQEVLLSLISYKNSPYIYSANKDDVSGAVIKINAKKKNGEQLELEDPDDPAIMSVDMSSVFTDENKWQEMEELKSVEGTFMLVALFNYSVDAIIIEINIKSRKVCKTYGKYSHAEPSETDFDISIETKGRSRIENVKPDDLAVAFENQILRLTIVNENTSEAMEPVVCTVLCEDYKLGSFGLPIHEYRIADVDLRYYNKESGTWEKSTELKPSSSKGKSIGFKSNFFGTFSANALFIPPEPIDFTAIFLNFHERLKQTPHVLATSIGLLLVFILISIPLRRMDRRDALLWANLPLVDNLSDARYAYEIVVYTDVRSAKYFTATPYITLKGKNGGTGVRLLLDGQRKNFFRGTSSCFTMRTPVHLGKLKHLKIWHDNSGDSATWLLSRVIVVDQYTGERYVFLCGEWLSMEHGDGQTWRKLFPIQQDILDGNLMFNELSKSRLFDDHLWLSLVFRPNYSCFSRVQRLWTIVALLFLSMIASAMWYNTADPTGGSSITIGPLTLNYKVVYVGFMSAIIAALPSLIIMFIFKNRRMKDTREIKTIPVENNDNKSLFDTGKTGTVEDIDYMKEVENVPNYELQSIHSDIYSEMLQNTPTSTANLKDEKSEELNQEIKKVTFGLDKQSVFSKLLKSTETNISSVKDGIINYKEDKGSFRYDEDAPNNENSKEDDVKSTTPYKEVWTDKESSKNVSLVEKDNRKKNKGKILLPWGFIFVGYFLILACIGTSSVFTFFYSLEWGPDKTVEWMMAFLFGTIQSVLLIEPFKVIVFVLIVVCLCKRIAIGKLDDNEEGKQEFNVEEPKDVEVTGDHSVIQVADITFCEYPGDKEEDEMLLQYKQKLLLDRRLVNNFRLWTGQFLYITIIAIICSHNIITTSYFQNTGLATSIKTTYTPKVRSDIWDWLEGTFLNITFPKWYYNNEVRSAYVQRFLKNTYNLKLGSVRIRQLRVKGSCSALSEIPEISEIVTNCPPKYTSDTEETGKFCVDWVPFNNSCFDENEETDYSFQYTHDSVTKALPYFGTFGSYGGGGYIVDIGPKQSLALSYIQKLRSDNWIDNNTRAVFAEAITYNANSRIFTHLRVVFEIPETGGIFMTSDIWSANLYPYISTWDYVVLGCQVLFLVITFVRLIMFLVTICRMKRKCCSSVSMWIRLLEILLAVGAIVSYIMRIDHTISAIETVFNNFGRFTSFESIHVLDVAYTTLISSFMFLVVLELLKPLTFSYYFYLMRTSLVISGSQLFGMFLVVIIPLVAFASLIYLYMGNMERDFRAFSNSFMTMLLVLIGMFKLSNNYNDVFVNFIFGIYTLFMTMISISVFVSILSIGYNEVKSQKNLESENKYDAELNEHFRYTITTLFRKCFPKRPPKVEEPIIEDDVAEFLMERIDKMDQVINKLNKDEVHYHRQLALDYIRYKPEPVQYLTCMISWHYNNTILTYTDDNHFLHLTISIPDKSWDTKITVSLEKEKKKRKSSNSEFPFNIPENKRTSLFRIYKSLPVKKSVVLNVVDVTQSSITRNMTSSLFVSYNNCKTWNICQTQVTYSLSYCENQVTLRTELKRLPTHVVAVANEEDPDQIKTDRFEINEKGGEYSPTAYKRIVVKIYPRTITGKCTISLRARRFGIAPMLEITASEDLLKPVKVTLPCIGELEHDNLETIVITRTGEGDWIKINELLETTKDGSFQFPVPKSYLQKNITATIIVKQSEIGWVDRSSENSVRALIFSKIVRTISANISTDSEQLGHFLGYSDADIANFKKKDNVDEESQLKKVILQKWSEDNNLESLKTIKILEEILTGLGQKEVAKWLKDQAFKLRCASTTRYQNIQLIKAINVVSRFDAVAKHWQNLSKHLEVNERFTKTLDTDIPRCCVEKCSLVLFQWYKDNNSATVEKLRRIIEDEGFQIVANKLAKFEQM